MSKTGGSLKGEWQGRAAQIEEFKCQLSFLRSVINWRITKQGPKTVSINSSNREISIQLKFSSLKDHNSVL